VDETAIKGIVGFIQKRFDLIKDSVLLIAARHCINTCLGAAQIAALLSIEQDQETS